ncbi:unnamed protein product [Symbiodinium sp. CCMP2592]|nr:unnamed protein product [Symbiodinium sp. CCMP2592]
MHKKQRIESLASLHMGLLALPLVETRSQAMSVRAFKTRARALVKLKLWKDAHADFQEGLKIDYDDATYEESVKVAGKMKERLLSLPLVCRVWKNGSNSSYICTPFLHSLLTKGK